MKVEPNRLEFAATDGHRLGIVEVYPPETDEAPATDPDRGDALNTSTSSVSHLSKGSFEVTVPAKALRELEKMLASTTIGAGTSRPNGDKLGAQLEQGQVVFALGDQKLTTRTLEGKYPDYRLLIPRQFQRQITIDRKQLLSALERIGILADTTNLVKFSIDAGNSSLAEPLPGRIALSVEAPDRGNGRELLNAQISGTDLEIAFNIKYLMDGLKTLPTAEITIDINGPLEPVILKPLGGIKMTYLVMPVQLRQ